MVVDLRTQAWLDDMFIYGGGNVYGPPQLKEETDARTEWAERFRSNFDYVLAKRELTALEYEDRTEISFDTDAEFYAYLGRLFDYLFKNGAFPDQA